MSVLILKPVLKQKDVWGGQKLFDYYPKRRGLDNIGEAWTLSARPGEAGVVSGGEFDGLSFDAVIEKLGLSALGKDFTGSSFPLLIKLIDAADDLSIQVHPDDDYAVSQGLDRGKTECWYIINAESDSRLVYGLKPGTDRQTLTAHASGKSIEEHLNFVHVEAGDVAFIPAGTVHAIGKGILLCEVQQNCDTTYRLYDFERIDRSTGKTRDLDIDNAVACVDYSAGPLPLRPRWGLRHFNNCDLRMLCSCDYFRMYHRKVYGKIPFCVGSDSFLAMTVISGCGIVYEGSFERSFKAGDEVFFTAGEEEYTIYGNFESIDATL